MKSILEYQDYRSYISDYYADRKKRTAFSWREFAKAAGFSSPIYLKQISEGKFNLSKAAAERVGTAMQLVGYELDYFLAMVTVSNAKNDDDKKIAFEKMLEIADRCKVTILEGVAFRFFEDWKNPVIRELAPSMPGAKSSDMAHVCRPRVSSAEVSETLSFLKRAGLLQEDENGNFRQTEKSVTTGPMSVTPIAVRGLHRQMGRIALEAIEGVDLDERSFSGLTLGLTRQAYDEIVEEIAAFRKKVVAIATRDDKTDEVYRMNIQFFPMTKKGNFRG